MSRNARRPSGGRGALLVVAFLLGLSAIAARGQNWPQFRGPHASGVASKSVPAVWDVASGQNVSWQTPLPGLGHASPIIWNDRLYIATAIRPGANAELKTGLYGSGDSYQEKEEHQWRLICLDRASGKVLWDKLAYRAVPRLERHTKATHANSTPATDGQWIVAILGSEGLFAFDMSGQPLWHVDLGKMDAGPYDAPTLQWGFASSPVLHDGKVFVQCDVLSEQFVAAFDARDGKQLWRTTRHDVATWSTPLLADVKNSSQLILNGWKEIGGYDLSDGRQLWRLQGGGDIPVASPILAGDRVILTSGHGNYRPIRAVRLSARGDITPPEIGAKNQAIIWCHPRQGNYVQTPILVGRLLWGCSNDGIVSCFDADTGDVKYSERIGGGGQAFTASPVAAGDKLYFTGERGDVFLLPATDRFQILQTNSLGGLCLATPAISDGKIYFRTIDKLLAIGSNR